MLKPIKQKIKQGAVVATLLLVSVCAFGSGHIAGVGPDVLYFACTFLGIILAGIFTLIYKFQQNQFLRVVVWVLCLLSLFFEFY
ncbi:MAG: hypothetical protein JWO06_2007 [Bacteroidota bacterium]|nr:hypothetical protein [Bacteroidota bacterium]